MAAFCAATALPAPAAMTYGGSLGPSRIASGTHEGSTPGWKAFAATYGRYFGGELAYIDFGKIGGKGPDGRAVAPALTAGVPAGPAIIYAKLGATHGEIEASGTRARSTHQAPFYGVGTRFASNTGFGLRVEYERYDLDVARIDQASLGFEFRFR